MKKGITPVVAIVLLVIITLVVVGAAYGFIIGIFGTATSKAAFVNGQASCTSDGNVTIFLTNIGQANISLHTAGGVLDGDVTIIRISGGTGDPLWNSSIGFPTNCVEADPCEIAPGKAGKIKETANQCGAGGEETCLYDVIVGGFTYKTRADCF